jgi:hypothetical protein
VRFTLYHLLAFGFYPVWLLAGAGDYLCHRRSNIERTSGYVEGLYHVAQFATIAVIVLWIAFFAASMAVFAIVAASGIAHLLLSYFDVRYTERLRYISPFEQHIHAFLDVIPLAAIAVWVVLEWSQGRESWSIALREPMLSATQITLLLVSVCVVAGGPILEEFVRTMRARVQRETQTASV